MAAYDGSGTTITFGTSGYSAALISIDGPGVSREAIDSTTMATTGGHDFIPADLYDGGEVELVFEWDGSASPPIDDAAETLTIDWGGTGNSMSFSAFCTNFKPGASIGERMTASMTCKVTGVINW